MKKRLLDYIDFERFNTLLEGFNKATGFVTAILDLEGNVISKSGWRKICTNFHRTNSLTNSNCHESDTILVNRNIESGPYNLNKCKNGLVDVVVPIKIKGVLVAKLFTGQFFLEKPSQDFFKDQARKYAFDETSYLEALQEVPIVSETQVKEILDFLRNLTQSIIDLTIEKIDREHSEMLLKSSLESPVDFLIVAIDKDYNFLYFNQMYKEHIKEFYDVDIFIGSNLINALSTKNDKTNAIRNYDKSFLGESLTIIEEYQHKEKRYFETAYNPIYDVNNEIIGSTVFAKEITNRIIIEKQLKESEQRFKTLHNASFGGITIHDKGLILDCNQGLADITGYSIDELLGMDGLLLIAPDYRDFVMNKIITGYEKPYEAYGIRKNKEVYPLKLEARNIPYNGRKVRVVEFRDLTEFKHQEEIRKDSEKKYKLLFETMNQGVVFHNKEGYITSCNLKAEEILGLSLNEMQGKTTMDPRWKMIDEQGNQVSGDYHPSSIALRTKKVFGPVVRGVYRPETEEYVWLEIIATPLFIEGEKKPNQVYATFDDITEKLKYEQEIKSINERLQLVMDNLPIGIAVNAVNPNVQFEYMNENFPKLYGVTKEELEKNDFWDIVYKEKLFRDKIKNQVLSDIDSGDTSRMRWENVPINNKEEDTRFISTYATPIPNTSLLISSVIDVTERKTKEIAIQYASNHDSLTTLPNRRYYQEKLSDLDSALYYPLGVIMMDLNRLKLINDAYGHHFGDLALQKAARTLTEIEDENVFIARLGGDEFAAICPNTSDENVEFVTNQIIKKIELIKINDIRLSIAVGYDIKYNENTSIDKVLINAENKMYKDKSLYHYKKHEDAISSILETLKSKYNDERVHSERVSKYCKLIGQAMGLKSTDVTEVEIAGMYHDIGKISIPDKILGKPGKLTEQEWSIMKNHTINGYQILRSVHQYTNIAEYAMSHHERIDGKGYPNGLKGEEIPLFSKIICVADAYEAMTSNRIYRKALNKDEAIKELKSNAGTQFDSTIVEIFITKVLM